ncbi:protein phosphatase 2C domain-containing protein [Nakamurella aerolata]|uniref:Serine/threonine-protein phosphatase n=1 Tax=Nakamurella aerolata TaxID=1656892 RepID=A0A849AGK7_9ACTN|nr:serine/threonine-protein phosphatase [Nakamurella aerolata]
MRAGQVNWGSATNRGRVRRVNEDAMLALPDVFVVSDGMGGHRAGDVAARTVIDEFAGAHTSADPRDREWVTQRVRRAGRSIRQGSGGGATVVGLVAEPGRWLAFNIGDSRAYACYQGTMQQITTDHSVVQELVDSGELDRAGMRTHPQRHVITRAIGLVGDSHPDFFQLPIREGERLLLCSDGLTNELTEAQIHSVLASQIDPQLAADALVLAAVRAGGRDNVTVVVVDVLAVPGAAASEDTRPRELPVEPLEEDIESTLPMPWAALPVPASRGSSR